MPHLSKIVEAINNSLKEGALSSHNFQGGKFYGLCKRVIGAESSTPALMDSNGQGIDVTPDDTYPFSIYHRCLNGVFGNADPNKGWGDHQQIVEVNNMVAIVYADPHKVKTTQEDLAFLIAAGLPSVRAKIEDRENNKMASFSITPTGFNNDSHQVFTGEYQQAEYPLQPQSIYFSLSYRIETTADRACVTCP